MFFLISQQITSEVHLRDNVATLPGEPLSVRYFSSCLGGELRQTKNCLRMKEGDEVEFIAQIEVREVIIRRYNNNKIGRNICLQL